METKIKALSSFILLVSILSSLSGVLAAPATVELKPGKYAVTITYEVQDQRPNESGSATRCIRQRDLDSPEKIFNDRIVATTQDECSVKNLKSAAGKISYDAECSNRTVHVQGNVSDTGFAVMRTVRPKASEGVSLKFTVTGRRTGDCEMTGKR